ncbi:MAG: hypothetical protein A3F11_00460 [Gammaproteobacteria bacterium RIFCSPHIGHO2_12_FULL_37_14]|nr:MAG: hypothetical protein A3F11_00460 [Gammaproteobacteria bacterium RIFCSPHIGHO2_12_FULL_37_14]
MINTPEFIIQSVETPEFIVEDVCDDIQSLAGGIIKQFTSQASPYAVIFKWDFGDGATINTHDRSIIHEYGSTGTYIVRHQACLLDAPCCYTNDIPWCTKSVTIIPTDICTWITSKGGWNNLRIFDIMTLVSAYLGQTNLGFTITIAYIMGAVAYYLNNLQSGNSLTRCSFT